jgi:hypothetical protein
MTATIKDEMCYHKAPVDIDMASKQIRQQMFEAEQQFQRDWPHRFVFFDSHECLPGEGTTDEEFDRIRAWITEFAGPYGEGFVTRGDPLGVSLCYGFKDADVAARFKLSFTSGLHQK